MQIDPEKVALFDLDGTLADYNSKLYEDLKRLRSPNESLYNIHNARLPEWYKARIDLIRKSPGWWRNLSRFKLGFDLLEAAIGIGFSIHVLTKGPETTVSAWTEKIEWCQQNLPSGVCKTITQDKSLVYGRILVDDFPEYQMQWLRHRPRGLAVIPVGEDNRWFTPEVARAKARNDHWDHEPHVVCYDGNNLAEVMDRMQAAYERLSKEPLTV